MAVPYADVPLPNLRVLRPPLAVPAISHSVLKNINHILELLWNYRESRFAER